MSSPRPLRGRLGAAAHSVSSRARRIRPRWWLAAAVLVIALAAGGVTLLGHDSSDQTERLTATVTRGTQKTTVSASGSITPKRSSDLAFASSGQVTAVEVKVGDTVHKGDELARIDSTVLRAQRDAAQAQVDAAEAQLDEDGDESSTQRAADAASLDSARSQLDSAQDALDHAVLLAPFAGTVSSVGYEVGDQVSSGSGSTGTSGSSNPSAANVSSGSTAATSSSAGISVISPRSLLVDATVAASDVSQLKPGLQAVITPTGGSETVYGTVSSVGVVATASDTGAAQFPVTIAVTGKPTGLYPGASATVEITVKQATDVLTVPTQALHTSDGSTYVYLVAGDRRTKKTVTVGTAYGMATQVESGLDEGDVVELASFSRAPGSGSERGRSGETSMPGGGFPGGGMPGQGMTFPNGGGQ